MNIPKNYTIRIEKSASEYANKRIEIGVIDRKLLLNDVILSQYCKKCKKRTIIKKEK